MALKAAKTQADAAEAAQAENAALLSRLQAASAAVDAAGAICSKSGACVTPETAAPSMKGRDGAGHSGI